MDAGARAAGLHHFGRHGNVRDVHPRLGPHDPRRPHQEEEGGGAGEGQEVRPVHLRLLAARPAPDGRGGKQEVGDGGEAGEDQEGGQAGEEVAGEGVPARGGGGGEGERGGGEEAEERVGGAGKKGGGGGRSGKEAKEAFDDRQVAEKENRRLLLPEPLRKLPALRGKSPGRKAQKLPGVRAHQGRKEQAARGSHTSGRAEGGADRGRVRAGAVQVRGEEAAAAAQVQGQRPVRGLPVRGRRRRGDERLPDDPRQRAGDADRLRHAGGVRGQPVRRGERQRERTDLPGEREPRGRGRGDGAGEERGDEDEGRAAVGAGGGAPAPGERGGGEVRAAVDEQEGRGGGVEGGGPEPDAEEHRDVQLLPHQEALVQGLTGELRSSLPEGTLGN